nr:ORF2 [Negevirus sp.]
MRSVIFGFIYLLITLTQIPIIQSLIYNFTDLNGRTFYFDSLHPTPKLPLSNNLALSRQRFEETFLENYFDYQYEVILQRYDPNLCFYPLETNSLFAASCVLAPSCGLNIWMKRWRTWYFQEAGLCLGYNPSSYLDTSHHIGNLFTQQYSLFTIAPSLFDSLRDNDTYYTTFQFYQVFFIENYVLLHNNYTRSSRFVWKGCLSYFSGGNVESLPFYMDDSLVHFLRISRLDFQQICETPEIFDFENILSIIPIELFRVEYLGALPIAPIPNFTQSLECCEFVPNSSPRDCSMVAAYNDGFLVNHLHEPYTFVGVGFLFFESNATVRSYYAPCKKIVQFFPYSHKYNIHYANPIAIALRSVLTVLTQIFEFMFTQIFITIINVFLDFSLKFLNFLLNYSLKYGLPLVESILIFVVSYISFQSISRSVIFTSLFIALSYYFQYAFPKMRLF